MSNQDEEARKARAKRLREQIGALTEGAQTQETSASSPERGAHESVHEFTQRRMREIAEAERKQSEKPT